MDWKKKLYNDWHRPFCNSFCWNTYTALYQSKAGITWSWKCFLAVINQQSRKLLDAECSRSDIYRNQEKEHTYGKVLWMIYISKALCICKWGIICPLCRRFRPHLNRGNYYWHSQNVKKIEDKNINVNNVNVTYINKRKTPSSTLKCSFKSLAPAITWSWQTQCLHTASSIQYKLGVNEINKHEDVCLTV